MQNNKEKKMSFGEERDIFRIKNNSVYGKTTNVTFNNAKKYETYKNELLGWKKSKVIV